MRRRGVTSPYASLYSPLARLRLELAAAYASPACRGDAFGLALEPGRPEVVDPEATQL